MPLRRKDINSIYEKIGLGCLNQFRIILIADQFEGTW